MKKRIPLSLLPTLALFSGMFLNSAPVSASTMVDGVEYWSVDELLAVDEEMTNKRLLACDTLACEKNYFYNTQFYSGKGIESAWAGFTMHQFVATAINPSTGEIRVLFRDENTSLKFLGTSTSGIPVDELYIAWSEDPNYNPEEIRPVFDPDRGELYPAYVHALRHNLSVDKLHIHVLKNATNSIGLSGDFPTEQEVSFLSPTNENFLNNPTNTIFTAIYFDMYSQENNFNYSRCVNSQDYKEGMECRPYFRAGTTAQIYLPVWPDGVEPNTTSSEEESLLEDFEDSGFGEIIESDEPIALLDDNFRSSDDFRVELQNVHHDIVSYISRDETGNKAEDNKDGEDDESGKNVEDIESVTKDTFTAPLSGEANIPAISSPEKCTEVNFPWWIVILLILGDVLVMWWFLPKKTKANSQ